LLAVSRSFMNVANRVLWRMMNILKANKVNSFVSSVLFVFWYHSPNVLDTPHICNISRLRVNLGFRRSVVNFTTLLFCPWEGDPVQRRFGGSWGASIFNFNSIIIIMVI
jgi:hypothetical protein